MSGIAFWQGLMFVMLICFVWVSEVLDLPAAVYGAPPTPVDWLGASVLTAGIILIGLITAAHTYVQQQRVLRGFVIVCAHCHRVKVEETSWQQLESYVASRTLAEFSHGICPSCYREAMDGEEPPSVRAGQPSTRNR